MRVFFHTTVQLLPRLIGRFMHEGAKDDSGPHPPGAVGENRRKDMPQIVALLFLARVVLRRPANFRKIDRHLQMSRGQRDDLFKGIRVFAITVDADGVEIGRAGDQIRFGFGQISLAQADELGQMPFAQLTFDLPRQLVHERVISGGIEFDFMAQLSGKGVVIILISQLPAQHPWLVAIRHHQPVHMSADASEVVRVLEIDSGVKARPIADQHFDSVSAV